MIDTYTKIMLTVIAICLGLLTARQIVPGASRRFGLDCDGSHQAPCLVRLLQ
jgi:hypothetical protein